MYFGPCHSYFTHLIIQWHLLLLVILDIIFILCLVFPHCSLMRVMIVVPKFLFLLRLFMFVLSGLFDSFFILLCKACYITMYEK